MLPSRSRQDNVVGDVDLRGYSFMVNEAVFILFSTLALTVGPPFTWNKFSLKSFTHLPYIIATKRTRLFSFISERYTLSLLWTYVYCNPPWLPTLQQMRVIVWLCLNLKNQYLMIHIWCWAHGMILCTSAAGLESHVADDTKESWPSAYKAINCKDPYHLTSTTSPFLGSSIFKTTAFMVKSHMKLVICSDYKRSTLTTTHWKVKYHPACPTTPMLDSSIFFGMDLMGKFQRS